MLVSVVTLLANVTIASCIACGAFAVLWPNRFNQVARFMAKWGETRPTVPWFDSRYDIDSFVLQHTRVFGVVVLGACLLWWAFFGRA